MSEYNKKLKSEIRNIRLQTERLRRVRMEMEADLEASMLQDTVDAHLEATAESRNWRN